MTEARMTKRIQATSGPRFVIQSFEFRSSFVIQISSFAILNPRNAPYAIRCKEHLMSLSALLDQSFAYERPIPTPDPSGGSARAYTPLYANLPCAVSPAA